MKDGRSIDEILADIMEGKEDHREIIETLKSVARDPAETEAVVEAKPVPASETAHDLGEQFLCPVCETLVAADATVCPGCGAEFSEGETTEYECPVCKASVPAEADQCPSCGARFAADAAKIPTRLERPHPSGALIATTTPTASVVVAPPSPKPIRSPVLSRLEALRDKRKEMDRRIPAGDRKLLYR